MSDVNKVFIDGRADIYERTGVLTDYLSIARLALPAPFLLNAYNVQSCLLERDDIAGDPAGCLAGMAEGLWRHH